MNYLTSFYHYVLQNSCTNLSFLFALIYLVVPTTPFFALVLPFISLPDARALIEGIVNNYQVVRSGPVCPGTPTGWWLRSLLFGRQAKERAHTDNGGGGAEFSLEIGRNHSLLWVARLLNDDVQVDLEC